MIQDGLKRRQITALIHLYTDKAEYQSDLKALQHTIDGLGSFLSHHPDAPDDSDRKDHQRLRDELTAMRAEAAKQKRIGELETVMASLAKAGSLEKLKESAVRFRQQLEESKDLQEVDKADMRTRARAVLGDWLINVAFPRKKPPPRLLERDNQEAMANNRRYIGKFLFDDLSFYKIWFWDGKKNPIDDPQGDDKVHKMYIKELVKPPRYVQWANVYNDTSETLARGGTHPRDTKALRQQWKEFFEQCKKTQEEFDRYQNRWGITNEPDLSCKDWTFLPDNKVLPHRTLDDLGSQLEDLWLVFQP
jgi:hypothetical protein